MVGKLFVAVLLTLCVGSHLVEPSDHWDRTLQDANDEAGIVAIVLCVGVALSAAATLLDRIRRSRVLARLVPTLVTPEWRTDCRGILPILSSSPPTALRI